MSAIVHFKLAPMSSGLRVLTYGLFILPAAQIYAGMVAPAPVKTVLFGAGAFMLLAFVSVPLFFRPSVFEVEGHTLTIRWLFRERVIDLRGAESKVLTREEFRKEYGLGYRIGAGGLFGAFGLMKTGHETFSLSVSRLDEWVLLRPAEGRALLITPEHASRFVEIVHRAQAR